MSIEIVEVIRRSTQGMTKPFICRGDDENIYFVKGAGAGRASQVYEWLAGNLAGKIGIDIAPFEIVTIPDELFEIAGVTSLSQLGVGPAFGSRRLSLMELPYSTIARVPVDIQKNVLAFDWWIRNADRMLSEDGGNPNLFWATETEKLVVIDHNQAFDLQFSEIDFLSYHVFSSQANNLFGNRVLRGSYSSKFNTALKSWPDICSKIPEEWAFIDQEMTVPADFDLDELYRILARCTEEDFWDHS